MNSTSGTGGMILTVIHPNWIIVMDWTFQLKYNIQRCNVCLTNTVLYISPFHCIDSVGVVRTHYNHTNPSISAFIRHFSRKLERITITIYGTGSQTTENEDNSVIVRAGISVYFGIRVQSQKKSRSQKN